jgi:FtsZ-binding cell division protein ZapB
MSESNQQPISMLGLSLDIEEIKKQILVLSHGNEELKKDVEKINRKLDEVKKEVKDIKWETGLASGPGSRGLSR